MSNLALTELLASYVPRLIQNRVIADPSPIEAPVAEEFQAAVLFADISGFTLLTERMAQMGPTGVEILARILNEYFGQLIDIIHNYGGDVVKFGKDEEKTHPPKLGTGLMELGIGADDRRK